MRRIIFQNATLFDSADGTLKPNASLVIEAGRIAAVTFGASDAGKVEGAGGETEIFDLAGRVVLPGLIDAHVHTTATTPDFFKLSLMPQSLVTAQSKGILEGILSRGYTTVRDAGGADSGLVQAVNDGHFAGPRMFIAGRALTQTGGHGDTRPAFGSGMSCVCCGSVGILGHIADGVSEVRRAARDEIRKGATQIKVMAGGGISSPNDPIDGTQYSIEELTAIVEEATAAKTYVMAHAYSPEAIKRAVRCGVRSIEHGNLIDADAARVMAEHGAFLVPTLATYAAIERHGKELGWSPAMLEKTDRVKNQGIVALRIAQDAGVKIGLGSDLLGDMHAAQYEELTLRQAVMKPADILRSATSVNAELMNQTGQIGVIAPGAHADLIVVDGNPLEDLAIFQKRDTLLAVMKGGRFHSNRLPSPAPAAAR
ncbi:amidohydrolase family protein [Robbsia sp. Bb-Pol-6]|uniref:Amidohydrolase family protein n=1 Tax=Robbsia betulipollinis TaxID=2981849 RepID=A0ABT3ZJV6_9BURK|nr:amidohydrolase family protein [Robbsia betulipollinis]MCY0386804.1 amidohydrolase family protein [Robbsia betulipollinis]